MGVKFKPKYDSIFFHSIIVLSGLVFHYAVYATEAVLKILALGPSGYFESYWNW